MILCLLPVPLYAQQQQLPQIGGGTCSSQSLSGTYTVTLTGRQIDSTGAYSKISQGNGSASFDGQSKFTLTVTGNTLTATAVAQTYTGTYTVQANCLGTLSATAGNAATFNLEIYNQGNGFLLAGSDATNHLTGGGSLASANACSTAKLAGVYSVNATGFTTNGTVITGVTDGVGLMQFDGKGAVTVNFNQSTVAGANATLVLTGTYSMQSSCLGAATVTDTKGNSYSLSLVGTSVSGVSVNGFSVLIGQPGKLTMLGSGHPLYNQPTAALFGVPATLLARGERA